MEQDKKERFVIEESDTVAVMFGTKEFLLAEIKGEPFILMGTVIHALDLSWNGQRSRLLINRDKFRPVEIIVRYPWNKKRAGSLAVPLDCLDEYLASFGKSSPLTIAQWESIFEYREELSEYLGSMWEEITAPEPDPGPGVIDRKFKILAVNPCNGKHYTEDNAILLCAKDKAVVPAMKAYRDECEKLGANPEHIQSVSMLIARLNNYQNHVESRVPDTVGDCELDRCIGGVSC